jgi:isopentenyl-diphosphate delta-isomerase
MPEEIGISCKFDYLFKFEYHVPYKNVGSENEICGTLLAVIESSSKFNLVEDEISEIRWISPKQLITELQKNPEIYCPWMVIALYLLPNSEKSMLSKYKSIISKWATPEMSKSLNEAVRYHLKDNNWRLVN